MPGALGAVGVALPMVLRSGSAGSSPGRGPGQMGVQGWGWSAEVGTRFSRETRPPVLVSAWPRHPLLAPTKRVFIPRFDASLLQATVTSAERPGASPAGELRHMGDSACARAVLVLGGTHSCSRSPRETGLPLQPVPMLRHPAPTQEVCSLWMVGTMPYVCLELKYQGHFRGVSISSFLGCF